MHQLRASASCSAAELAERSGISRSMLSRIERGLVSPSIDTVSRLATGLGVPVARLFAEPAGRPMLSFVRGHGVFCDAGFLLAGGLQYCSLGHLAASDVLVEPGLVRFDAACVPSLEQQDGASKFVHVLQGQLLYRYGERLLPCAQGDSLLFEASTLHGVQSLFGEATLLSIVFRSRRC